MSAPKRVKVIGNLFNGRIPDGAVYIGRAFVGLKQSPFANPWVVKAPHEVAPIHQHGHQGEWIVRHHRDKSRIAGGFPTRDGAARAAVLMYRSHLDDKPELRALAVEQLRGKDLACWCKDSDPCHGDVLLELVAAAGA